MHGGYGEGLIAPLTLIVIGLLLAAVSFAWILLAPRYSPNGMGGVLLFFLSTILAISAAVALDNFLWDALKVRRPYTNIALCSALAYLPTVFLLRRVYRKGNRRAVKRALLLCACLLAVLCGVWFLAETVL